MKILQLKIIDELNKIIRVIDFEEVGISYVYGDIQEPKNLGATINSLGKTLLLKFIDYIYGANEDSKIVKFAIHGYVLEAKVKYDEVDYIVRRTLGSSEKILINDEARTLAEYKDFFKIDRSIFAKQIILNKKANALSFQNNPNQDDIVNILTLLKFYDVVDNITKIYNSQDKIKAYKKNKKDLITFYGDYDLRQIDEEIYFVDKEVIRLTEKLEKISQKIKNLEISEIKKNIVEDYVTKGGELKKIKKKYDRNKLECLRLIEFINNSNKVDITSEHIIAIYKKTKQEIPEFAIREIEKVEAFHRKVFDERKEFLEDKKQILEKEIEKLEPEIKHLSDEVDKLGKIIAANEVYQESMELYEKYNSELNDLKYKEGQLSQIKTIDDNIKGEDSNLVTNFDKANLVLKENYSKLIGVYRDYIYNLTKTIYDENVQSYFGVTVRKKHQVTRPVAIEVNLKGDTGEGVSEVKKNLIDYLLFRYNTCLEFLIQDSACYSGIDPRQISNMLNEIDKIAQLTDKQAIISINKYQLGEYEETINLIKDKSAIILSEKDKLLGFDFD